MEQLQTTDYSLQLTGFMIFLVFFVGFVMSTYLKSQIRKHKHLALLPLEDSQNEVQS